MFSVRYHIRSIVVAAVAGALFVQLLPAGVFAVNGEDARFDEINWLLNDPEMLRWLLDAGKFSSLERRNFLNKNAFILGNFVFELNLLKNKLLQLEKSQKGVNELAALKTRAEINNIDSILNYNIENETLSDIIAEKKKLAEVQNPNVTDVLKKEVLFLEIFKEISVPGLSGITDLFSSQTDKDAANKSLELILAHLNEKISYILEMLKMVQGRGRPETGGAPPVGEPEPPVPPKSPGAVAKNINFTLRMSSRTVDAALAIAEGIAPARRFKTISSNGIVVSPEIRDGNLYLNVAGGMLDPDSVSVDAGEGALDVLSDFFFGGVEPEVSGNGFSFALDANALAGKPVELVFTVRGEAVIAEAGTSGFYPLVQLRVMKLLADNPEFLKLLGTRDGVYVTVFGRDDGLGSQKAGLPVIIVDPAKQEMKVQSTGATGLALASGVRAIALSAAPLLANPAYDASQESACSLRPEMQQLYPPTKDVGTLIDNLSGALWMMGAKAFPLQARAEARSLLSYLVVTARADQTPSEAEAAAQAFNEFWNPGGGLSRMESALTRYMNNPSPENYRAFTKEYGRSLALARDALGKPYSSTAKRLRLLDEAWTSQCNRNAAVSIQREIQECLQSGCSFDEAKTFLNKKIYDASKSARSTAESLGYVDAPQVNVMQRAVRDLAAVRDLDAATAAAAAKSSTLTNAEQLAIVQRHIRNSMEAEQLLKNLQKLDFKPNLEQIERLQRSVDKNQLLLNRLKASQLSCAGPQVVCEAAGACAPPPPTCTSVDVAQARVNVAQNSVTIARTEQAAAILDEEALISRLGIKRAELQLMRDGLKTMPPELAAADARLVRASTGVNAASIEYKNASDVLSAARTSCTRAPAGIAQSAALTEAEQARALQQGFNQIIQNSGNGVEAEKGIVDAAKMAVRNAGGDAGAIRDVPSAARGLSRLRMFTTVLSVASFVGQTGAQLAAQWALEVERVDEVLSTRDVAQSDFNRWFYELRNIKNLLLTLNRRSADLNSCATRDELVDVLTKDPEVGAAFDLVGGGQSLTLLSSYEDVVNLYTERAINVYKNQILPTSVRLVVATAGLFDIAHTVGTINERLREFNGVLEYVRTADDFFFGLLGDIQRLSIFANQSCAEAQALMQMCKAPVDEVVRCYNYPYDFMTCAPIPYTGDVRALSSGECKASECYVSRVLNEPDRFGTPPQFPYSCDIIQACHVGSPVYDPILNPNVRP